MDPRPSDEIRDILAARLERAGVTAVRAIHPPIGGPGDRMWTVALEEGAPTRDAVDVLEETPGVSGVRRSDQKRTWITCRVDERLLPCTA